MKKRLLITSVVMMLVVAVALSTATYAWFSSNTTVKANAVTLTAATMSGDAILIADTNYTSASSAGTTMTLATSDKTLYPATPISATFWIAETSKTIADNFINLEENSAKTSKKTIAATEASFYTDEIFIFNLGAQSITLSSSTVDLTYSVGGNNKEAVDSVRVAIIEQKGAETADGTAVDFSSVDPTLVGIYQIGTSSIATVSAALESGAAFSASAVYALIGGTADEPTYTETTIADQAALDAKIATPGEGYTGIATVLTYKATTISADGTSFNYGATESSSVYTQGSTNYTAAGFGAIGTASSGNHICNKYTVYMWLEGWDAQCTNAASAGSFDVAFTFKA